jgi:hypothetical protein
MGIASFVAGDSEKGITRTRGAKIVFIVAAGCIGAAVWAAGVVVQLHRATGLARLGPDSLVPTEDVWTVLDAEPGVPAVLGGTLSGLVHWPSLETRCLCGNGGCVRR